MNPNNPAFLAGLVTGGLVAGGLCGMLPMSLALKRNRIELGIPALIMCVLFGLVGGLLLAIPAALIGTLAVAIMSKPRNQIYRESNELLAGPIDWTSLDPDAPPPPLPAPVVPRADRPMYEVDRPARSYPSGSRATTTCPACDARIPADIDRNHPWCPRCGADLKSLIPVALD